MYVHVCAHVWMCVDTRVKRLPLSLAILNDEAKSLKEPGISNLARLAVQQAFPSCLSLHLLQHWN